MSPDAERRKRELAAAAPADVDLSVLPVCRAVGHVLEGRVAELERGAYVLVGRCQRCGLGFMADH